MQRIETSLPGVWELRPKVFGDARGSFMETYHRIKFSELGITIHRDVECFPLYDSAYLRLWMMQLVMKASQGVLLLSAKHQNQIYIPIGFAHGVVALTDRVQLLYKCSDFYDFRDECGVLWSDPDLKISWGISTPFVSEKDAKLPTLAKIPRESLPQFKG